MYLLKVGIGVTWLGIIRKFFVMGDGGTVDSSVEFVIEVEWIRISETWSKDKSLDTLFSTGLIVRY